MSTPAKQGGVSEIVRICLSIEKPLFERLEKLVANSDYGNWSEFIRDLIRAHLVEQEWPTDKTVPGTMSLLHNHHARRPSEKPTEQQHFSGKVPAAPYHASATSPDSSPSAAPPSTAACRGTSDQRPAA